MKYLYFPCLNPLIESSLSFVSEYKEQLFGNNFNNLCISYLNLHQTITCLSPISSKISNNSLYLESPSFISSIFPDESKQNPDTISCSLSIFANITCATICCPRISVIRQFFISR